jgi:hypothetical protein
MDAMGPKKWAFLPRLQSLESANPGATMSKLVSGMPAEREGIALWLCRLVISTIAGATPLVSTMYSRGSLPPYQTGKHIRKMG